MSEPTDKHLKPDFIIHKYLKGTVFMKLRFVGSLDYQLST